MGETKKRSKCINIVHVTSNDGQEGYRQWKIVAYVASRLISFMVTKFPLTAKIGMSIRDAYVQWCKWRW